MVSRLFECWFGDWIQSFSWIEKWWKWGLLGVFAREEKRGMVRGEEDKRRWGSCCEQELGRWWKVGCYGIHEWRGKGLMRVREVAACVFFLDSSFISKFFLPSYCSTSTYLYYHYLFFIPTFLSIFSSLIPSFLFSCFKKD